MRYDDDSDMKIVGASLEANKPTAGDDISATADLLHKEKESGNLSRARRLGAIMAEEVSASEGERREANAATLTQRRILLAFAVEVGFEKLLPSSILTETAQSVFYETLRNTAAAFFEDLKGSGAFSFYLLVVRDTRFPWDAEPVYSKVGETFASLCGRSDDSELRAEGAALYERSIEQVKYFTQSMGFAE